MSALWTSGEAAAATGGVTGRWQATGLSIDTRTLSEGDLFIALKDTRDGHDFVADALQMGAAAAMVDHVPPGVQRDKCLVVKDVQVALQHLAQARRAAVETRPGTPFRLVAITGSVGKTSTKEMLRAALSSQGKTHASQGNQNNHLGVPLTLARMALDTEFAVIEVGMSNPGEIAPLARLARPHVVLITAIAPAHMEALGSLEGIAREKASICEGLLPGGSAVLNGDAPWAEILLETAEQAGAKVVLFGTSEAAALRLMDVVSTADTSVVHALNGNALNGDQEIVFKVNAKGRHFALNALGALAAAVEMGADMAHSMINLAQWRPLSGRGEIHTIALDAVDRSLSIDVIDDTYNANPSSITASLEVLANSPVGHLEGRVGGGRRIAILGDMLELGADEIAQHRALAKLATMEHIDVVHCVGDLMGHLYHALPQDKRGLLVQGVEELLPRITRVIAGGDVILVKGSLSMNLRTIVDAFRQIDHHQVSLAREGA